MPIKPVVVSPYYFIEDHKWRAGPGNEWLLSSVRMYLETDYHASKVQLISLKQEKYFLKGISKHTKFKVCSNDVIAL